MTIKIGSCERMFSLRHLYHKISLFIVKTLRILGTCNVEALNSSCDYLKPKLAWVVLQGEAAVIFLQGLVVVTP